MCVLLSVCVWQQLGFYRHTLLSHPVKLVYVRVYTGAFSVGRQSSYNICLVCFKSGKASDYSGTKHTHQHAAITGSFVLWNQQLKYLLEWASWVCKSKRAIALERLLFTPTTLCLSLSLSLPILPPSLHPCLLDVSLPRSPSLSLSQMLSKSRLLWTISVIYFWSSYQHCLMCSETNGRLTSERGRKHTTETPHTLLDTLTPSVWSECFAAAGSVMCHQSILWPAQLLLCKGDNNTRTAKK